MYYTSGLIYSLGPGVTPYTKLEKTRCSGYGKWYVTIEDARTACSSDENCGAFWDSGCNNDIFYICPKGYAESSSSGCLYVKPESMYFDVLTWL